MKTIIISLGGSIIIPDSINTDFLKEFKKLIESYIDQYKFVIYCGGGSIARKYQESVKEIIGSGNEALDWMGISATHLNAFLLKSIFTKNAESKIIKDPTVDINFEKPILIAGGWKPGWSTDYDAVLIAKNIGSDTVINMSNIDYVYDSDPKKNPNAKKIESTSWKDFRKIVGDKWSPGLNMPFDPIAAKEAEKNQFKVVIIGNNLENLRNVLEEKEFKGTIIN